jgi:hypothetical protein
MTTRVHIVNFGPDAVNIEMLDPQTGQKAGVSIPDQILYSQQSSDIYVHDTQAFTVVEAKKETKKP